MSTELVRHVANRDFMTEDDRRRMIDSITWYDDTDDPHLVSFTVENPRWLADRFIAANVKIHGWTHTCTAPHPTDPAWVIVRYERRLEPATVTPRGAL